MNSYCSPQAKAYWHNYVSLNNIFYSNAANKNLPLAYKLPHSSLLAYSVTILHGIISCHQGLICLIEAQDARVIMDG